MFLGVQALLEQFLALDFCQKVSSSIPDCLATPYRHIQTTESFEGLDGGFSGDFSIIADFRDFSNIVIDHNIVSSITTSSSITTLSSITALS